jgi:NADH dehydrogenase (ubiquinone) 1 alpha/beta subcomplex 1
MNTNAKFSRSEIESRVIKLLKCYAKIDQKKLSLFARFQDDLGLDSLDNLEIIMAVGEDFSIEVPDNDAEKLRSVNQLVDYLLTTTDIH